MTTIPSEPLSQKWIDFYSDVAKRAKQMSTVTSVEKVGCCLVKDNKIVGVGYNGLPKPPREEIAKKESLEKDPKARWICDAVMNAVAHSSRCLEGAVLFVTNFPSCEAARIITQYRMHTVYYLENTASLSEDDKKDADELLSLFFKREPISKSFSNDVAMQLLP